MNKEEGGCKMDEARPITKFPWNFSTVADARAGACSRRGITIMHARMLIDTWVGWRGDGWRRLGAGARVERYLSLCIPFRRPSLFYILQEEAYRLPLPIFPAGQKGTAGNLAAACAHASPYMALTVIQPFALRSRFLPTGRN